jgi:hypothetical protein
MNNLQNNSTVNSKILTPNPNTTQKNDYRYKTQSKLFVAATKVSCMICKAADHKLHRCTHYENLTPQQKFKKISSLHLCRNCFGTAHGIKDCKSTNSCIYCKQKHHSTLHDYYKLQYQESQSNFTSQDHQLTQIQSPLQTSHSQQQTHNNNQTQNNSQHNQGATTHMMYVPTQKSISQPHTYNYQQPNIGNSSTLAHSWQLYGSHKVLLATAIVLVVDAQNHTHKCRALLDSGSQSNFISESFATLLGIKRKPIYHTVYGVYGTKILIKHQIQTSIKSRITSYSHQSEFLIAPEITNILPAETLNIETWNIPSTIQLADPSFNISGKIDLLLGASNFLKS